MWICTTSFFNCIIVARRSNQSILTERNPEYSLEGLMLKLKLWYFGQLIWRANSLRKILMLGKIEDRRKSGWQRMRWLDDIIDSMNMSKIQEIPKDREAQHAAIHWATKSWTWLSCWATVFLMITKSLNKCDDVASETNGNKHFYSFSANSIAQCKLLEVLSEIQASFFWSQLDVRKADPSSLCGEGVLF